MSDDQSAAAALFRKSFDLGSAYRDPKRRFYALSELMVLALDFNSPACDQGQAQFNRTTQLKKNGDKPDAPSNPSEEDMPF